MARGRLAHRRGWRLGELDLGEDGQWPRSERDPANVGDEPQAVSDPGVGSVSVTGEQVRPGAETECPHLTALVRAGAGEVDRLAVFVDAGLVPAPVGEVERVHRVNSGQELGVGGGDSSSLLKMYRGGGPPPRERVDIAELAVCGRTDSVVADVFGEVGAVLQQQRTFVVMTADRVHQRRSELQQAARHELLVAGALRVVAGSTQALQSGIHRARRDRGSSGLEQRSGHGSRRHPVGGVARWRRAALRNAGVASIPSSVRNSVSVSSTWVEAASWQPAAMRLLTSNT